MIKGLVSRRTTQRIPYEAEIGIQFACDNNSTITASTTNLSPDGVRFFLPKGKIKLAPDEIIELVFHLPKQKEVTVQGEICYFSNATDGDEKPVVYYGVRFINLTNDAANAIDEFCQLQLSGEPEPEVDLNNTFVPETNAVFDPETMDPAEFEIPEEIQTAFGGQTSQSPVPETPLHINPPFQSNFTNSKPSTNENGFRSLSQEMIDQIIRSMNPAPSPKGPSSSTADLSGSNQTTEVSKPSASTSNGTDHPLSQIENHQDLLAQIRKIAESINLKIDDELFDKISESPSQTNSQPTEINALPETIIEAAPGLSTDDSSNQLSTMEGLNFLDFTKTPVEEDNSSLKGLPSSQSSLIDMLYGTETKTETPSLTPKPVPPPVEPPQQPVNKPSSPTTPAASPISTQSKMTPTETAPIPAPTLVREPEKRPEINQAAVNPISNKSSSVSMDQRMIDQIIQSLLKKQN